MNRKITERYVYDRLGRVSDVYSKNGSGNKVPVAHYDYYPTGSVRTVKLGNSLTLSYTYHISGAVKTAEVRSADNRELYADTLYYEDCGSNACTPQYNGNISRMAHHLAHENNNYGEFRDVRYTYDELNRLTKVDDSKQDVFDEMFAYDAQGRITAQRRAGNVVNPTGGEYSYYSGKNRLKSVADNMGGTADERNMSDTANFVYDSVGNLTYDKSKGLEILYDWRGMPIEFIQQSQPAGSSSDTLFRLLMKYDGTGRRISKTVMHKVAGAADWDTAQVTHYTGIGTEIRENYAGPAKQTKVVVNMPQGLGRYGIEDAENPDMGSGVGYIPNTKFEWYLKNHLGSTMLVYGTQADANPEHSDIGTPLAAYDYRAFGEQVNLVSSNNGVDKVTENFTGKELDDEIALNYFGARYLDPMLGMWISVDPARQFASPYLYAGNGVNPIGGLDPSGTYFMDYDGNVTEGEFVPPEFQGFVSPDELIELQYAIEKFMESPGNVETLYSMAKYTLNHDVETRYWYDSKGQNNFAFGKFGCVLAGSGSGLYIHVHNWRPWSDMGSEGLSPDDVDWSNSNGSMMAYEIRSGHVYYTNISLPKQYRIMTIPMGGVLDATEFQGPMQDARPLESCETKEIK